MNVRRLLVGAFIPSPRRHDIVSTYSCVRSKIEVLKTLIWAIWKLPQVRAGCKIVFVVTILTSTYGRLRIILGCNMLSPALSYASSRRLEQSVFHIYFLRLPPHKTQEVMQSNENCCPVDPIYKIQSIYKWFHYFCLFRICCFLWNRKRSILHWSCSF